MKNARFIRPENSGWHPDLWFSLLCAYSEKSTNACNEGVHWLEGKKVDIFFPQPGSFPPALKDPEFSLI